MPVAGGLAQVVIAVADAELRDQCVALVLGHPRLQVVPSADPVAGASEARRRVAFVLVGVGELDERGVSTAARARGLYPGAVIVAVTASDLQPRIDELAALTVSTPKVSSIGPAAVQRAIEDGGPDLVFQPVVDLRDRRLIGLEALARFRSDPYHPPDRWFVAARQVGLDAALECSILRRACDAVPQLPAGAYIAVNVSPATLLTSDFSRTVESLPLAQLVLEITEHAPVEDYIGLCRALQRVRERGVRIAIDDVGAGFASLRHVLRLDPDIIKLDLEVTRGVESDAGRAKLVGGLIAGASAVSTLVIAEGIETEAQLCRLIELGVRGGQGYFLGRPSDIDRALSNVDMVVSALPKSEIPPPPPPESRPALSGARILVVDDSSSYRSLLRTVFEFEGAAVSEASSVANAIHVLTSTTPDLVILDVRLPDGNGFDLLAHIRRTSDIPTMFVTAASAVSDRIAGFDLGAVDYLLKPFSPEELVSRVDAVLRRRYAAKGRQSRRDSDPAR